MPSIQLSKFITIPEKLYYFGYHMKHIVYNRSMSCYSRRKEYQKGGNWRTINIMERSLLRHFEEGSSEAGVLGRYKGSYLPNVPHQATSVRWARFYQTFTATSRSKSILGSSIFRSRVRGQLFAIVETRLMYERVHINRAQHLTLHYYLSKCPVQKLFSSVLTLANLQAWTRKLASGRRPT